MASHYNIPEIKETMVPVTCHTMKKAAVVNGEIRRISDKETVASQISQLGDYTALNYLCTGYSESFLIVVELNPEYPGKGKKYIVNFDDIADCRPAGNRLYIAQSNRPKQIARWLLGRNATLYNRQP